MQAAAYRSGGRPGGVPTMPRVRYEHRLAAWRRGRRIALRADSRNSWWPHGGSITLFLSHACPRVGIARGTMQSLLREYGQPVGLCAKIWPLRQLRLAPAWKRPPAAVLRRPSSLRRPSTVAAERRVRVTVPWACLES